MNFNMKQIPYSIYGSSLSVTEAEYKFSLHNCAEVFSDGLAMDFWFCDDGFQPVFGKVTASPSHVLIEDGNRYARIVLDGTDTVYIESHGLKLKIAPKTDWNFQVRENHYRGILGNDRCCFFCLEALTGTLQLNAEVRVNERGYHQQCQKEYLISGDENGEFLFAAAVTEGEKDVAFKQPDLSRIISENQKAWESFLQNMPAAEEKYRDTEEFLWYNIWSCFLKGKGLLAYDTVLMSKNSMCAVWSWDHCFNALTLARAGYQKQALEQFFSVFEQQSEEGKLPDLLNVDRVYRSFVKPPIHGWCLMKLMEYGPVEDCDLEKAYHHLAQWTDWHFRYRDTDRDGIPEYLMGNDSGWDNSTLFDVGSNMETPDLPAYLIMQMECLKIISEKLGNRENAAYWQHRRDQLEQDWMAHSYQDGAFHSFQSITHKTQEQETSLLSLMPLALGKDLPKDIRNRLISRLKEHHLTPYGLATESVHSDRYMSDGYWRGPIWAPSTYLITDGLYRAGEIELAVEIERRFCDMVAQNGAYENFDAQTGKGLRDMGYTWTSAVTVCMMSELLERTSQSREKA